MRSIAHGGIKHGVASALGLLRIQQAERLKCLTLLNQRQRLLYKVISPRHA